MTLILHDENEAKILILSLREIMLYYCNEEGLFTFDKILIISSILLRRESKIYWPSLIEKKFINRHFLPRL